MFLARSRKILLTITILAGLVLIFLLIAPEVFLKNYYTSFIYKNEPPSEAQRLKKILKCRDRRLELEKLQHGDYWTIENLIIGTSSRNVGCAETITYTTIGDFTFLDSLPMVVKRWHAPISLALFSPGYDVNKTLESMQYLRNCLPESELIRKYVSLHIFFPNNHMPAYVPRTEIEALNWNFSCQVEAPYLNVNRSSMYKTVANLTYPINVARNIARKAANTYFIFPCDIELIPSPQLPEKFLQMVLRNESLIRENHGLRVFALPVFEVEKNSSIPTTKTELKTMLKNSTAVPFHGRICKTCHLVPEQEKWLKANETEPLNVTAVGKREGKFAYWEPFYISDNREPLFDERVTWEGQSNKRIQNFAMCLMEYEYLILHPAFLTHMPGIKTFVKNSPRLKYVRPMNKLIKNKITPEYKILYGNKTTCKI